MQNIGVLSGFEVPLYRKIFVVINLDTVHVGACCAYNQVYRMTDKLRSASPEGLAQTAREVECDGVISI